MSASPKKQKSRTLSHSGFFGAPAETRTPDPLIKSQMLYRLSYRGIFSTLHYISTRSAVCQGVFEKNDKKEKKRKGKAFDSCGNSPKDHRPPKIAVPGNPWRRCPHRMAYREPLQSLLKMSLVYTLPCTSSRQASYRLAMMASDCFLNRSMSLTIDLAHPDSKLSPDHFIDHAGV